jgi:hypothetical protein
MARYSYVITLEYLEYNWPDNVLESFMERTEQVSRLISMNPYLYPYSEDIDAYKCVVVKQISLFYRLKKSKVEFLVFFDNRQNPEKLKEFIY